MPSSPSTCATLVALLRHRAELGAVAPAYTFLQDGDNDARSMSYAELDVSARAIGARLQMRVRPGERVLVLLPPGLEFIAGFFGCLYAGAIAVPVPLPQRKRGLPRLVTIVRDCQPSVVLTSRAVMATFTETDDADPALAELRALTWLTVDDIEPATAGDWRPPTLGADTLAFLQYTSGSTAAPKGVVLSHDNLLHNQRLIELGFAHSSESVIVGWLPPYHDMGLIGNILQPLYVGGSCVQMAPQHFLMRPWRWLAAISRYRATTSGAPNFAYELCAAKIPAEQRAELDLRSWAVAFNGAEPVRAATLDRFAAAFAIAGFRREAFYPCYGLAEATLFVSGGLASAAPVVRTVERGALAHGHARLAAPDAPGAKLVGCGRLREGLEVRIVDPERRTARGESEIGEIWVSGGSVAQGYWNRADDTAETFAGRLIDGDGDNGRYLRTGDLGFFRDGELFVTGRLKDLLIVRGRNLYPQDLELSVEGCHPSLRAGGGAAFQIEVDGEDRVVVVHEVGHRAPAQPEDIAAAARAAIARDHEVSVHAIAFIRAGSLPRTTSGKVQRRACRAQYLAGTLPVVWQGAEATAAGEDTFDPPATPTERALAAIWSDVLGRGRIGRDDDFLAIGGDSLRAMQIAARAREACGVDVGPAQLFETPTLATLATAVEARVVEAAADATAAVLARPARLPLSRAQERLWFLEQLVAGRPVYHVAAAVHLDGALDVAALEGTLTGLVARHEGLRTRFPWIDGQVVQHIEPAVPVGVSVRDADPAAAVEDAMRDEIDRPFDLAAAPPVRWVLVRRGDRDHVLAVVCHHIVVDGWSMQLLLRELTQRYAAAVTGLPFALPDLRLQYADHALLERAGVRADEGVQLDHWRERLRGAPRALELPTDRPRPALPRYAGDRVSVELPVELIDRLTALGRREGTTLFAALVAGLASVLTRYSGQPELVLGTPVAVRRTVELEAVIGCFLNTVALRLDVADDPAAAQLVARVGAVIAAARRHQEVAFERVLETLALPRDPGRTPLFQAMISMQPPPWPAPAIPGVRLAAEQLATGTAQFDLAFDVIPGERGTRAVCEYDADLFDAATVRRWMDDWRATLEGMVARPTARVGEIALASVPALSHDAGSMASVEADAGEVHARFAAQAACRPDAIALVDGHRQLTYAAVLDEVRSLAQRLRDLGVGPERRVGLWLDRSPEAVISALAVLEAGGAYVPLDPAHPKDRLAFVLEDAEVAVVITRTALAAGLPATSAQILDLDQPADLVVAAAAPVASADRLAYIIYTSGSTGRPKGVTVTHRTLAAAAAAWRAVHRVTGDELRLLQVASPAFDVWTADWIRALCSGGTLVLAPADAALDADALAALIERERVTVVDLVPAVARLVMAAWERRGGGMASLRVLIVGSDVWPVKDYRALREQCAAHTRLLSCYGVTEATVDSAWCEAVVDDRDAESAVPLGRGFPGTRLHVLDRHGHPAPIGVPGELVIGGIGVARGYWRQPALTAERFVPDRFSGEPGARLYRTGDRARWLADGTLEFLGRLDHQVKLRGLRIELLEIEAVLREQGEILDAVVVVHDPQLVAYAVAAPGSAPSVASAAAVKLALRARLPEAMVPSSIVWLDALPLSPNGKIDRRALAARPLAPREAAPQARVAPRSEVEHVIAAIWSQALSVATVGIEDNFFDLGGHSLLLAEIRPRIVEAVGREVAMLDLFRYPTVASLATALSEGGATPARAAAPGQTGAAQERRREVFARRRGGKATKR